MRDDPVIYTEGIEGVARIPPYIANQWLSLLEQGSVVTLEIPVSNNATIHLEELENNETGGFLANSLTSWGPTWELGVKPNIAAPGENILSTYLTSDGSYRVMTGTSMCKRDTLCTKPDADHISSCTPCRRRLRTTQVSARKHRSCPVAPYFNNNVEANCLA